MQEHLQLSIALAKSVGEVLVAFYATIANKIIMEEGRMMAKQEVTDFHRWYQQLENTQQHDALMMEGLRKEVQSL
jgi:uncharacterized membrane protein (DUF106 family)